MLPWVLKTPLLLEESSNALVRLIIYIIRLLKSRRITRGGGGGEVSPALFQKLEKSVPILENNALIVSILG